MKNIFQKFTKPLNLVVDASVRTPSVANLCMLLLKYRRYIELDIDPSSMTEAMLRLIPTYAKIVLSKASDIDGDKQVCSSTKVHVKAVEAFDLHIRLDLKKVAEWCPPMQNFPPYLAYYVSEHSAIKSSSKW